MWCETHFRWTNIWNLRRIERQYYNSIQNYKIEHISMKIHDHVLSMMRTFYSSVRCVCRWWERTGGKRNFSVFIFCDTFRHVKTPEERHCFGSMRLFAPFFFLSRLCTHLEFVYLFVFSVFYSFLIDRLCSRCQLCSFVCSKINSILRKLTLVFWFCS